MVPAIFPTKKASQVPGPMKPSKVVSSWVLGEPPDPEEEGALIEGVELLSDYLTV